MIVYIYNDNLFLSFNLPESITGMYPLYDENNKAIANIISNEEKYIIQLSDDFIPSKPDGLKKEIVPYKVVTLEPTNSPEPFNVVMLPKYEENTTQQ